MVPYYLLIILPFFCGCVEMFLHPYNENVFLAKRSNIPVAVFFAIWFIMLSLRHDTECGWDLKNYQFFFYQVADLNFLDVFKLNTTEPLYFLFNWFVASIYPDFRLLMVVVAFLCTGIVGWFYYRKSDFSLLTILLFITSSCFVMFYSGLRQSLAMLFTIPAYYFTIRKWLIPFILTVILAQYFHNSAIILAVLYPVFHIPLRSKHFLLIMITVALFILFKTSLFAYVVPFLSERFSTSVVSETGAYSVWIMFLLFLLYSFLVLDDSKMDVECLGLRNILVIMTLIQGFAAVHSLAMRMNYYFILLFPIIIPKLMKYPKVGNENVVLLSRWGMVLFYTFYFFYNIHSGSVGLGAFPYVAYWE